MFSIKTNIQQYDTFGRFAEAYGLGADDLVITQTFVHRPYIEPLGLDCHFVMQDEYGAGEPSDEMIQRIMDRVRHLPHRRVVAVGGGTVIDVGKLLALGPLADVTDAFLRKTPLVKQKQLVVVPTTCGTGSEVTDISIAELKRQHTKLGLADAALLPDHAVLIPQLLATLPFKPYAFSAIDALVHAVESYLSPWATAHSQLFSTEAIRLIVPVFRGIQQHGPDHRLQHLEPMLRASNYAGIAFGNAGCGAVHALSYPLGANHHVPHGESNYQLFTPILALYARRRPTGPIADLNALLATLMGCAAEPSALYARLDEMLSCMVARRPLRQYGMLQEECETFADSVLASQQRLLANNYVPLGRDEMVGVYTSLY